MRIYAFLFAAIVPVAYAQTPAPKPASPPKAVAPPAAAAPKPQTPAPAKGPFADLDPERVVATIGNEKMTAAQFNAIVDGIDPKYQAQVRGPAKRQFMEQVVMIKLLARQAVRMHLDQVPANRLQLQLNEEKVLANTLGRAMVDNAKVDSEAMTKYYEDHKSDFQQVSAHHILIRFKGSPIPLKEGQPDMTEEEALAKARDLRKRLQAGEDFAAIATAESADAGSAAQGGDLGAPFRRGQMVKEFEDAAFSLPVGQLSEPVKSQFGYHLIRVDKIEYRPLNDVRTEMLPKVKPDVARRQMEELRANMGVKLDEAFFGPPPAAPAPPAVPQP